MISTLAAILLAGCQQPTSPSAMEYELRKLDLGGWAYRDTPEGTAKDPFVQERNRQKNRHWIEIGKPEQWKFDEFVSKTAALSKLVGLPESGKIALTEAQMSSLEKAESPIISVEGYLTLVYPGPKESVNGDLNFHD